MKVSVNGCSSQPIQQALSNNLALAGAAATKMATGEQFQYFFEDPTSNAIGLNMRSNLGVLRTVLKGIEQSQSMLFLSEAAANSSYLTLNKMKEILAQAKLAYMNDELIQATLSPTYVQLKAEINRIADSVNFNGQPLANGQGGIKVPGTATTVSSTAVYEPSAATAVNLAPIAASKTGLVTGISAMVNGATTTSSLTFGTGSNTIVPEISGGVITTNSAGNIIVTNATITLNGVTVTDTPSSGTPVTGTGNLIINNVSFTYAAGNNGANFSFVDGTLTSSVAPTLASPNPTASDITFVSTGGEISTLTGFSVSSLAFSSTDVFNSKSEVTNMIQTYALSGGIPATSAFTFVTGTNLNTEVIQINLPNLRLTSYNGVLGMIDTINTPDNINDTPPTNLTNLTTVQDANTDIPLVEALLTNVIAQLDQIGAYEVRLGNIEAQLQGNIQQVDIAQGVFMDCDLADQAEKFTVANVKISIAIACLQKMNSSLQALQQLAQG